MEVGHTATLPGKVQVRGLKTTYFASECPNCGETQLEDAPYCPSCGVPRPVDQSKTERLVAKVKQLAAKLEGEFKKFPRKGKSFIAMATSRYIVAEPSRRKDGDDAAGEDPSSELAHWKLGRIAYWTDKAAYLKGDEQKGHVDLMKITKVTWERDIPNEVNLRHKGTDGDSSTLTLVFDNDARAEDWHRVCWQLRTLLDHRV